MNKDIIIARSKTGSTYLGYLLDHLLSRYSSIKLKKHDPLIKRQYFCKDHFLNFLYLPDKKFLHKYREKIILIRDVRDILVSEFFHKTYRSVHGRKIKEKEINDFCIKTIERTIKNFFIYYKKEYTHIIKYEDINTQNIKNLMDLLCIKIDEKEIQNCINKCSFENMKQIELSGNNSKELRLIDITNNETFKVRRGKIHGYKDYLDTKTINILNNTIDSYQKETPIPIIYNE